MDYASTGGGLDLDGRLRGIDLPITFNLFGAGDLGAYERPALLPLVRNGAEPAGTYSPTAEMGR